jgi:RNA polymerase sigma-70 factor (ECF subfamily)
VGERLGPGITVRSHAPATAADGYRAFIEAHLDEAYRLATFLLGQRAEAEDAVHDAAISAWRHWTDRRDLDRTEAWFRRIVINACHDRHRGSRRIRAIDVGLDIELAHHPLGPDPADAVGERAGIVDLLRHLSPDERTLLTLRFGLDLTVPAIASVLGVREGTVKSRLHRTLAVLRTKLSEQTP